MRTFLLVPLALLASSLSARADELDIGKGVVCETLQQMQHYVALRGNGTDTAVALQVVNDEAHDETACGVAAVMFSAGERVGGMAVQGRLLSIIQINVHAFSNGRVWTKIPDTIRYTVTAEKGQVV
jgi:hypothetical protein